MGQPNGFMQYERQPMPARDPLLRINDFHEIYARHDDQTLMDQGARCMDCGVPFCQSESGCPIDNQIPEWNDLIYRERWHEAYLRLTQTNNFPEFTGRICPAPCESACVLGINASPVTIKSIECSIIDRAFDEGWVLPNVPETRTGKTVAIVGSGPAGLAAADQLNKAGHHVTVYERDDRIGGLLMYGVPNMKLEKKLVERRVDLLRQAGITFITHANVGGSESDFGTGAGPEIRNVDPQRLVQDYDAVLLACGALKGRDLGGLPGRELKGVEKAMAFLWQNTKSLLDSDLADGNYLSAKDKHVVVIGGGDTGTDCIATAIRHGAASVTNITRREREPDDRDEDHPWPGPTGTFYVDYGHAEGSAQFERDPRRYGLLPKSFAPSDSDPGRVGFVEVEKLDWQKVDGRWSSKPTGAVERLPADLVLLSIGFTGHDTPALLEGFGLETAADGSIATKEDGYRTGVDKVYAAGDVRRGASLIVWAIAEGRGAARAIDTALMGQSFLPAPGVDGQLAAVL